MAPSTTSTTRTSSMSSSPKKDGTKLLSSSPNKSSSGSSSALSGAASETTTTAAAHDSMTIALVGTGSVGKSSLVIQFTQNTWDDSEFYNPTIEDTYVTRISVNGTVTNLTIIDTSGQEDITSLRESWIKTADGILFVYDVTEPKSLRELEAFARLFFKIKHDAIISVSQKLRNYNRVAQYLPVVIIANKVDLLSPEYSTNPELRKNTDSYILAETLSRRFLHHDGCDRTRISLALNERIPICHTSAKTREGVVEAFETIVTRLRLWRKLVSAPLETFKIAPPPSSPRPGGLQGFLTPRSSSSSSSSSSPRSSSDSKSTSSSSTAPFSSIRKFNPRARLLQWIFSLNSATTDEVTDTEFIENLMM
eukprot:GEZU01025501.1.p1 GENE.GEZU01025501.1~~GEZU01025501.1.p1  ORF type:complete len:365 (-),score=53.78 GEZU01025501.1:5-1099(-)